MIDFIAHVANVQGTPELVRHAAFDETLTFELASFAGILAAVLLIALIPDHILPSSLVLSLLGICDALPAPIARRIKAIEQKQRERRIYRERVRAGLDEEELQENGGELLYIATHETPRGETGVQAHFNELIRYLRDQHIRTKLISSSAPPPGFRQLAGLACRTMGLFSRRASTMTSIFIGEWALARQVRLVLPREGAWRVYAQCPRSALAALRSRRNESQQVVLVVHFNISQAEEMVNHGWIPRSGWFYRWVRRKEDQALLSVDRILFVSKFMQSCLTERLPALVDKPSMVLPNFVHPHAESSDGPEGDVITIGTLEPRKNQQFLLQVLAEAKVRGKAYSLTIVGTGEDEKNLRALAESLGIEKQVMFTGFIPNASRLLSRFRVYAHASRMENLSISIVEAMAAGLPILAFPVGGIPELITEGVTGYFMDAEDAGSSADSLIRILEDEKLRRSMGAAGRDGWRNQYSTEVIAPQVYRFIRQGEAASEGMHLREAATHGGV